MLVPVKRLVFSLIFNSFLFIFLIVVIQNSSNKNKVIFFNNETIELPTSFIFGVSFIAGSVVGSFTPFFQLKKNSNTK